MQSPRLSCFWVLNTFPSAEWPLAPGKWRFAGFQIIQGGLDSVWMCYLCGKQCEQGPTHPSLSLRALWGHRMAGKLSTVRLLLCIALESSKIIQARNESAGLGGGIRNLGELGVRSLGSEQGEQRADLPCNPLGSGSAAIWAGFDLWPWYNCFSLQKNFGNSSTWKLNRFKTKPMWEGSESKGKKMRQCIGKSRQRNLKCRTNKLIG